MFRRSTILFLVLLPAAQGAAQLVPIRDADTVLVGDIVAGQAVDRGTDVTCNVSVVVDRTLKGALPPGQSVSLTWQFSPLPNQGPQITTKVFHAHALFFLKKNDSGGYELIRAGNYPLPMGGYFLPVPSGPLASQFSYAQTSDFETKLAGELGADLEAIATRDGSGLDVHYAPPPSGGYAPPPTAPREDVDQFQSLCLLFNELNPHSAADVAHYFAASPFAHLQAIGLLGELKLKDASAILALEKNMDALGRTQEAFQFGYATGLDLHDKPDVVKALGRMSIAESAWFGFDFMAVNTLVRADGLVAVAYLRVMLDNPRAEIRKTALEGLCSTLARNGEPLADLCSVPQKKVDNPFAFGNSMLPSYSVPKGSDAERSAALKTWLDLHHPELPQFKAPSWYQIPATSPPDEIAISPGRHREIAFRILLARLTVQSEPARLGLKFDSSDSETFHEITAATAQKEKANTEILRNSNTTARLANRPADPAAFCKQADENRHIINDGLSQLESRLSADGRVALENYLNRWPVHEYADPAAHSGFWIRTGPAITCNSN